MHLQFRRDHSLAIAALGIAPVVVLAVFRPGRRPLAPPAAGLIPTGFLRVEAFFMRGFNAESQRSAA